MEITELEEFFRSCQRPEMPVYLNQATKVNDFDLFLESHLAPLRANPDSKINKPLLFRLKLMKLIIESN
ncbi:MAG: hypothetical protein EOO45_00935 [Flavobacterium sp.]|nr:MAG: hypothetical protein EOO45_00935 [Flavobacterium sp.]